MPIDEQTSRRPSLVASAKRKRGRPSASLIDNNVLNGFSMKDGFHVFRQRRFHPSGLEVLTVPCVHGLQMEIQPREDQLRHFELSAVNPDSVREACFEIVRQSWRNGDRVQVISGTFIDAVGDVVDIDRSIDAVIIRLAEKWNNEAVEIQAHLHDIKRYFKVGDRVRVAVGVDKGTCGTILSIEGDVVVILDENAPIAETESQIVNLLGYLETFQVEPTHQQPNQGYDGHKAAGYQHGVKCSFRVGDHVRVAFGANAGKSGVIHEIRDDLVVFLDENIPTHEDGERQINAVQGQLESFVAMPTDRQEGYDVRMAAGYQDPDIGQQAIVYVGHMKDWQGRLVESSHRTAKIECVGRYPPFLELPKKNFILLSRPDRNLVGTKLNKPFIAPPSRIETTQIERAATPPPVSHEITSLGQFFQAGPGSGQFLLDPILSIHKVHYWVTFDASYERGSLMKRIAHTEKERFGDNRGTCVDDMILLTWTDNRAQKVHKRVPLCHLKPAPPCKKGQSVVILGGVNQGFMGLVVKCMRSKSEAVVDVLDKPQTYSFNELCLVSEDLN